MTQHQNTNYLNTSQMQAAERDAPYTHLRKRRTRRAAACVSRTATPLKNAVSSHGDTAFKWQTLPGDSVYVESDWPESWHDRKTDFKDTDAGCLFGFGFGFGECVNFSVSSLRLPGASNAERLPVSSTAHRSGERIFTPSTTLIPLISPVRKQPGFSVDRWPQHPSAPA